MPGEDTVDCPNHVVASNDGDPDNTIAVPTAGPGARASDDHSPAKGYADRVQLRAADARWVGLQLRAALGCVKDLDDPPRTPPPSRDHDSAGHHAGLLATISWFWPALLSRFLFLKIHALGLSLLLAVLRPPLMAFAFATELLCVDGAVLRRIVCGAAAPFAGLWRPSLERAQAQDHTDGQLPPSRLRQWRGSCGEAWRRCRGVVGGAACLTLTTRVRGRVRSGAPFAFGSSLLRPAGPIDLTVPVPAAEAHERARIDAQRAKELAFFRQGFQDTRAEPTGTYARSHRNLKDLPQAPPKPHQQPNMPELGSPQRPRRPWMA